MDADDALPRDVRDVIEDEDTAALPSLRFLVPESFRFMLTLSSFFVCICCELLLSSGKGHV